MALTVKYDNSITQLRTTTRTERDSRLIVEERVFEGPYTALESLQASVYTTAKATTLTPTEAGQGRLIITLTNETDPEGTAAGNPEGASPGSAATTTLEVEWVELRKKLEDHPRYASLTTAQIQAIHTAVSEGTSLGSFTGLSLEFATKLARGVTDYAVGVPVVRRTSHNVVSPSSGSAWVRATPPGSYPSGYEWLKTADRISRSGSQYTRTEEWTAAKTWDADLYP